MTKMPTALRSGGQSVDCQENCENLPTVLNRTTDNIELHWGEMTIRVLVDVRSAIAYEIRCVATRLTGMGHLLGPGRGAVVRIMDNVDHPRTGTEHAGHRA